MPANPNTPADSSGLADTVSLLKPTLLIVDSSQSLLKCLEFVFRRDYKVLISTNANEALALAQQQRIHVALIDDDLPNGFGIQIAQKLKILNRPVEVVMMGVMLNPESLKSATLCGVRNYVSKPFDLPALRECIAALTKTTRSGARPLNEAKLILVGRGGVGKTSLVKRLLNDTFNEHEIETPGIEIQSWEVALRNGDQVRIHVWDFGGQEILHATHQFFLTEQTVYLLVLNGRDGNATRDAEYWLQLIRSLSGDSKVIIALNKYDEHIFDLNRGFLLEKYPCIVEFLKTDSKTKTGLSALKEWILSQVEGLALRKLAFPADWFAIKERLSDMEENYLTWDQYQDICCQLGAIEGRSQRDLARYLHILGIALNYSDDLLLRDTHVLNPRWVTDGIYSILRIVKLAQTQGVLHPAALRQFVSPLLSGEDINDSATFASALCSPFHPVSEYIFKRFSPDSRAIVIRGASRTLVRETELRETIAFELNKLIKNTRFFDNDFFDGIVLRPGTEDLMMRVNQPEKESLLNRLLLEDTYPSELKRMRQLLDPDAYPEPTHAFLLGLMERFQLCFKLPNDPLRYLIPELLEENQPDLKDLLERPGLAFQYQYAVLPEGLLPRFIVQTHTYSELNSSWRWRTGVVLGWNGCQAVVRADHTANRIAIHVIGPESRPRELLAVIREKFEEQHRHLKGVSVSERVPIPGEPAVTVSYLDLLQREEEGEQEFRPEGGQRKVRVAELLNGVETKESRELRRERESCQKVEHHHHYGTTAPTFIDIDMKSEQKGDEIKMTISGGNFKESPLTGKAEGFSWTKTIEAMPESDLKKTLEELARQVEHVIKAAPPGSREKTRRNLDLIVSRTAKATPKGKRLELSMEGLQDAATAVAGLGAPIASTVDKIRKYLGL